ncbi:MAG: type II toxin-antitoxin system MqsR family toxin [Thermodesulfobacteriota bacterium]
MDKFKPTHILRELKKAARREKSRGLTLIATQTANSLGFSETEVFDEIQKLEAHDFYKSTTEYSNHKIWQDVYKKTINHIPIYIKLKLNDNFLLVLSFKQDTKDG